MKILKGTSILTEFGYIKIQDITTKDKLIYNNDLIDIESITKEKYSGDVLLNTRKLFNIFKDKSLERITKVDNFHIEDSVYDITVNKKYINTLNGILG